MCTLQKNVAYFPLILGSVFSDCVVFYGDIIFILLKSKNLNFTWGAKGTNMHHRAKFNQNRSKGGRYGDLTVFIMAAVSHLGFLAVKRPILCLQCFDTVGWAAGRASGL